LAKLLLNKLKNKMHYQHILT